MRLTYTLFVVVLAAGCGEESSAPIREQGPVVSAAIAELEAGLSSQAAAIQGEIDVDHVQGLTQFLSSARGLQRELPLEEIVEIGAGAAPILAATALNRALPDAERSAAIELLGALGGAAATGALLEQLEKSADSWVRAHAAWRLSEVGEDTCVPRLLARFKYEKDPEARLWIASALGAYTNYAGLETLWALRNAPPNPALGAAASERLDALAEAAGVQDASEHWELYTNGDPDRRLAGPDPSRALRLAAWRRISMLSGEHFQLRGVDDARYILTRLGPWVIPLLADSLSDEDVYVRVHAAQCLERMGRRAFDAGPALLAALEDPRLAPGAASALGAIAYPTAEPELRQRVLPGTPHDLRVAAVRALERLAISDSIPALRQLLEGDEPLDLRQAAAHALVALGQGTEVTALLLEFMQEPAADRHGAEAQVENWLVRRQDEQPLTLLEAWRALDSPPGIIPTAEQDAERLAQRAELLRSALSED